MYRGFGLLVAFVLAMAACGKSTPTAPTPTPSIPPTVLALRIEGLTADAAVVGDVTPMRAVTTMSGGVEFAASDGVHWSSSNERVASIDQHGVLTALAEGTSVVSATLKVASSTRSINVVANVAGDWTLSFIGTACDDAWDPGCSGRPKHPSQTDGAKVTLTQTGSQVSGKWTGVRWITGYPPFSGRINIDGSLDLAAEYRLYGDSSASQKFFLHNWHMDRAADGSYNGRLTWEQASSPAWWYSCDTEPTSTFAEVLIISNFRRPS